MPEFVHQMIVIDGSRHSGSGSIVRQAVVYAAITGTAVEVRNARSRRPQPGLRHQHLRAVEAVRDLAGGTLVDAHVGSQRFRFHPGDLAPRGRHAWDVGTAGSATLLALAVLPLVAVHGNGVDVEIRGGLFQDHAPSPFHLQHVVLPYLARMGVEARIDVRRPGYVPKGQGILSMRVAPTAGPLRPLMLDRAGALRTVWGIALSSHLRHRQVSERMAEAARAVFAERGIDADIGVDHDETAVQAGAALAVFAALDGGARLGADRAGAPRRRAESIGAYVAHQLLEDLGTGATVDRFAADQLMPFAALAAGRSCFSIPSVTDHIDTARWLAATFLDVPVTIDDHVVHVHGRGTPRREASSPPT